MMAPCLVCRKKFDPSELLEVKGVAMCPLCMAKAKNAPPAPASSLSEPEPVEEDTPDPETKPSALLFDLSRLTLGSDIVAGDYQVSFVVDRLIPESSVSLFYAKGGSGKSTLATQIGAAVSNGAPFMGLDTSKRPVVVVDYENPLAVLKKRIEAVEGAEAVYFWTGNNTPPQLDKTGWVELKQLVQTLGNPLVVIDTLSSSCSSLDISSNKDFSPVMSKVVGLRDAGATVVLLHHTPKGDETRYIGASCIYNQCDHILAMYGTKTAGNDQEAVDDDDVKTYRLGTKEKTRFEHFHLYVEFDDCSGVFVKATDPDLFIIENLQQIIRDNPGILQSAILSKIGPKGKIIRLLHNHTDSLWTTEKGAHNSRCYYTKNQFASFPDPRMGKLENRNQLFGADGKTDFQDSQQSPIKPGFASFSGGSEKQGKLEPDPFAFLEEVA